MDFLNTLTWFAILAVSAYVGADIAETSLSSFVQDRLLDCSPEDRMKVRKLISANLSTDSLSSSLLRVLSLEQGGIVSSSL